MTELGEYGFMLRSPENLEWIRQLFNDDSKTITFHNAKYDLLMFLNEGIDVFEMKAEADCTLIMSKLLDERGEHTLKWLSVKLLSRSTEDKDEVVDWLKANTRRFNAEYGRKPNFGDAPLDMVKRRNLWDVESGILLHRRLRGEIRQKCEELYQTERQLMFTVIDMEHYGVQVDLTRARELKAEAERDLKRIKADLDRIVCPITIERKKRGKLIQEVIESGFNPGSSQLQMPAAFKKLGIELKYKTKPKKGKKGGPKTGGGRWSFDEYAMLRYVSKPLAGVIRDSGEEGWTTDAFYEGVAKIVKKWKLNEREWLMPLVLKARELSKMVNTYYNHFLEFAVDREKLPNGREIGIIHGHFNQSEALTGRFSSSKPNLQNMPRILGPRECIICRRGRWNVHIDYEQVEMKFFVHFSEDEELAEAIKSDIHLHVASEIYNVAIENVTEEQRKRAKGINFGILYGAGARTMAETLTKKGIPTTESEARKIVAEYHRRFPSIRRLTNKLKVELSRNGMVVNPFGRMYHISEQKSYVALNYLCQGTSADVMKRAMVKIWKWLRARRLHSRMILTVHDEIVIEVARNEMWIVPVIERKMEERDRFFIPITVDAKISTHRWSNKRKPADLGYKWN